MYAVLVTGNKNNQNLSLNQPTKQLKLLVFSVFLAESTFWFAQPSGFFFQNIFIILHI